MTVTPSVAVRLYGTEEPVEPPRILRAGPLSVELEAGNLRYVCLEGVELMRAMSFIVRDRNWGTYNPDISNLKVLEREDGFTVSYDAVAKDDAQEFRYAAEIEGSSDGRLSFRATGRATTDFVTNRTGFVVLHAAEAAGGGARIEHVDGKVVDETFPEIIDPVQPMMDLRALTHEPASGLGVTCRMEGDTFEMEDQRNWTDASYKTYVRPLALPWPYTLKAGETVAQAVSLTVEGRPPTRAGGDQATSVRVGGEAGQVPALGAGLDPDDAQAALDASGTLAKLGISHLVCHHDPRRGHDRGTLERSVEVAKAIGATPWLEAVVAELDGFDDEIARLGETVAAMGSPFATVLVSPAPDLKCTLPGSPWPPCPPLEDVYRAARKAFPRARLGGGMFSYFTELNRKRPPRELLDLVTFTTSGVVHAGDDRSVMEGLTSLPFIAASARAISEDTPFVTGPSAIGMRGNPYGEAPMENPRNIRQAMNRNDPRQRSLLGAAWNMAYFRQFAYGAAEAVTLGGLVGAFGLVYASASWPQPWFEENGKGVYPVFHVVRGLARLAGARLQQVEISAPGKVQALAATNGSGAELWLANLTSEPQSVSFEGMPSSRLFVLDQEVFAEAASDPDARDRLERDFGGTRLELAPYAVAAIRG